MIITVFLRKAEAIPQALSGRFFVAVCYLHIMRKLFILFLLISGILTIPAQEFDTHWISIHQPDSLSHVWFRRTYLFNGRPQKASITFATTGLVKIYINECNIGTASFYPLREENNNDPVAITLDVSPYLRSDSNVIAAVYSPAFPEINHRQLSVSFYGTDETGTAFCNTSDNSWLCRRANSSLTLNGGEIIDGRAHNTSWKAVWFDTALWTHADSFNDTKNLHLKTFENGFTAPKIKKIHTFEWFNTDNMGIFQEFYPAFRGFLRLTLREARRGERINFGNIQYICSGEMDEQVFPLFNISSYSTIHITGDKNFKPKQLTTLEAIEMEQEDYFDF